MRIPWCLSNFPFSFWVVGKGRLDCLSNLVEQYGQKRKSEEKFFPHLGHTTRFTNCWFSLFAFDATDALCLTVRFAFSSSTCALSFLLEDAFVSSVVVFSSRLSYAFTTDKSKELTLSEIFFLDSINPSVSRSFCSFTFS